MSRQVTFRIVAICSARESSSQEWSMDRAKAIETAKQHQIKSQRNRFRITRAWAQRFAKEKIAQIRRLEAGRVREKSRASSYVEMPHESLSADGRH